jgi:hypothetical protein
MGVGEWTALEDGILIHPILLCHLFSTPIHRSSRNLHQFEHPETLNIHIINDTPAKL